MGVQTNSLLVSVTIAALSGCANTPKPEAGNEIALPPASRIPATTVQPVMAGAIQETESQKFGRLIQGVAGRSVYFAYDDFTIKPEYRESVQAHAAVLNKTPRGTVVVEGNADQRGSREYNLALGQKRAEAVSSLLKTLGVAADKLEAVSFGEEKPRTACPAETCWAENRRADFSYKLK